MSRSTPLLLLFLLQTLLNNFSVAQPYQTLAKTEALSNPNPFVAPSSPPPLPPLVQTNGQPIPCACTRTGASGSLNTTRAGCGQWLALDTNTTTKLVGLALNEFVCYVAVPDECRAQGTPLVLYNSTVYPGAAYRSCTAGQAVQDGMVRDTLQVLRELPLLTKFYELVLIANATRLLSNGSNTVLAPTNQALDIAKATGVISERGYTPVGARSLISRHIIPVGGLRADTLRSLEAVTAADGRLLATGIDSLGRVTVGGAPIAIADILLSDGMLHLLDGVIPPSTSQPTYQQEDSTEDKLTVTPSEQVAALLGRAPRAEAEEVMPSIDHRPPIFYPPQIEVEPRADVSLGASGKPPKHLNMSVFGGMLPSAQDAQGLEGKGQLASGPAAEGGVAGAPVSEYVPPQPTLLAAPAVFTYSPRPPPRHPPPSPLPAPPAASPSPLPEVPATSSASVSPPAADAAMVFNYTSRPPALHPAPIPSPVPPSPTPAALPESPSPAPIAQGEYVSRPPAMHPPPSPSPPVNASPSPTSSTASPSPEPSPSPSPAVILPPSSSARPSPSPAAAQYSPRSPAIHPAPQPSPSPQPLPPPPPPSPSPSPLPSPPPSPSPSSPPPPSPKASPRPPTVAQPSPRPPAPRPSPSPSLLPPPPPSVPPLTLTDIFSPLQTTPLPPPSPPAVPPLSFSNVFSSIAGPIPVPPPLPPPPSLTLGNVFGPNLNNFAAPAQTLSLSRPSGFGSGGSSLIPPLNPISGGNLFLPLDSGGAGASG